MQWMYLNALICIFQIYLAQEVPHFHDTLDHDKALHFEMFVFYPLIQLVEIEYWPSTPPPHLFGVIQSED